MDIEQYMWIIWLVVFVLALVIEAIGTDLVSIWFAAGALIALILSLIQGVNWWIELIVFMVVSIATLCCFRPLVHRFMRRDLVNSNVDEMVHKKGTLIAKIDLLHHGEVKINDVVWTAIADEEKTSIPVGAIVEVLAVSGNKLIVKEVKEEKEGGH
jgi:membrane protein implicated in regulation of membrane protease activity